LNAVQKDRGDYLAVAKSTPWSRDKIDMLVAATLAYTARNDAVAKGALHVKSRKVYSW
jgi:hypothetical protein